jgi:hypothetical protein
VVLLLSVVRAACAWDAWFGVFAAFFRVFSLRFAKVIVSGAEPTRSQP